MSDDKESENIPRDEYEATQALLLSCAQMVRLLPLDKFLRTIEKSDAITPLIDPTLWQKAHKNLYAIKKMAQGALAFQNSLPQVCLRCKVKEVAYKGARYCGAVCSAQAGASEE
jgi:hypothetical protein